jgi:AcrR family transcriptional regulator
VISGAAPRAKRSRPLRADAKLNREKILGAAAELFAERGLSVPLEDIAARAGVGVATLYRRFPSRSDLAAAAFERNISRYTEAVDRALANPRARDGFETLVFELCELQASDAGLRDLLTTAFPANSAVEGRTAEAVGKVKELIGRAQDEGSLRRDVVVADVVVLLLANAGVLRATSEAAPEASRRFAAVILDAFRAAPDAPLPPAPPEQQLRRSIALLGASAEA